MKNNLMMSDRAGFYEESNSTSITTNNNETNDEQAAGPSTVPIEKEHMFDKVVTPSDVGKLNRLVIPKQHAEKYFPLDTSTNEKGLLLNFQDRNGKPWRFRYSYWNSSQSYVMTKGWSRFVKEKKLDAGDIVSFQRGVGDKDRLFIDWRRRPDAPDLLPPSLPNHFSTYPYTTPYYYNQYQTQYGIGNYGYNNNNNNVVNGNPCPPGSIFYLSPPGGTGSGSGFIIAGRPQEVVVQNEDMVYESVPVVQGKAVAKRLRLFGVNMDCPIQESHEECDQMLTNTTVPLQQYFPASTTSNSPTTSTSSFPSSLQFMRPNYNDEKGKGSMSLDLDI